MTHHRFVRPTALVLVATLAILSGSCSSNGDGTAPATVTTAGAIDGSDLSTAGTVEGDLPRAQLVAGVLPAVHELDDAGPEPCAAYTLQGPLFATGSAELNASTDRVLDDLASQLRSTRSTVRIIGHTDRTPISMGNQALSELRADAVRHALVNRGVDAGQLHASGRGDTQPLDPADTPTAYAQNRRVEVLVACD